MLPVTGTVGCWVMGAVSAYFYPATGLFGVFLFLPVFFHPFRQSSISVCVYFIDFYPYFHTQIISNYHMQRKGILSTKKSMSGGSCERGANDSSKSDPSLAQETYLVKITLPLFPVWPEWMPTNLTSLSIPELTMGTGLTRQGETH